jgi:uncharacterized protein YtpQ (UPF0354 family)
MYAIDRPTHLEYVSNQLAADSGMTAEGLHLRAVENLPRRVSEIRLHDCGRGIFGLSAGGTFEASLLLVDDIWDQLAVHFPGELLAAVPSRDLVFAIGSEWQDAHELIANEARVELADKRYAISSSVLVRRDGKWTACGQ